MATLTVKQLAATMKLAGFYPPKSQGTKTIVEWLNVAYGVCIAESGGDPAAKNSGSSASGLWQIMYSVHKDKIPAAVAELSQKYQYKPKYSEPEKQIFDPLINTVVTRMVYGSVTADPSGFAGPWNETYSTGKYKSKMNPAFGVIAYPVIYGGTSDNEAIGVIALGDESIYLGDSPKPWEGITDSFNGMKDALDVPGKIIRFIKDAALPVGTFILGIIILILGVWFILNKPVPMPPVAKIAKRVAK